MLTGQPISSNELSQRKVITSTLFESHHLQKTTRPSGAIGRREEQKI